ncbi:nitrate- and nitrite sensing domain-containing protein [Nocardia sp. NPDC005366]|uniref:sensor histidine kinase n=1 Tax=Nocardia sp. NPDC005366 TaxID=3156878 RepID=UPI0033A35D41
MDFARAVQQERRFSLMQVVGDHSYSPRLQEVRPTVDASVKVMTGVARTFEELNPGSAAGAVAVFERLSQGLSIMRAKVDTGGTSVDETYAFYGQILDTVSKAMSTFADDAPRTEIALRLRTVYDLFRIAEAMSRAQVLASAGEFGGGLSDSQLIEVARQAGFYRTHLEAVTPLLVGAEQSSWKALSESTEWRILSDVENALVARGGSDRSIPESGASTRGSDRAGRANAAPMPLPVSDEAWQDSITAVSESLLGLWTGHATTTSAYSLDIGASAARNSLYGGALILLITVGAFLVAARLSARMVRRLIRLRAGTIALTDQQLPTIIQRLESGEPVDLDAEMTRLDFGADEIGQVAEAFNRAQLAAVRAAAKEARTRDGANSVFLNIAHRSQTMLHRHLKILNDAEYEQEDPKVLEVLFQLHHLATRERRNAENLIILGGEQPRRQWRNPVELDELVRGAVAESQDYHRVRVLRVPAVKVVGGVIADLIHLLAELVDNATSFSPPDSKVEVSGNAVGKGVVIEIVDQGLGMLPERMAELNETLSKAPDFAIAALSDDNRLGMFVIARLSARINVTVRLANSEYGGIKAVVLIPSALLTESADPGPVSAVHGMAALRPSSMDELSVPSITSIPEAPDRPRDIEPRDRHQPYAAPDRELRRRPLDRESVHGHESTGIHRRPPDHRKPDDRPPLPRRERQKHLAPQLASDESPEVGIQEHPAQHRTADEARNLFSAIENGTRQGREAMMRDGFNDNRH